MRLSIRSVLFIVFIYCSIVGLAYLQWILGKYTL